ncbi:MAG: PaaI family thioesterase [Pseudomonadota bacterium]
MTAKPHNDKAYWRPDVTAAVLNARSPGFLPGLVGMEVLRVEDGILEARVSVRPELMATNGFLHAASVIALADTSCGYATLAHLPPHATSFTTIELKANLLGTVREGGIRSIATAQHLGKSTQVWDAVVTAEATGRKIALFRCTEMILYKKD